LKGNAVADTAVSHWQPVEAQWSYI